MWDFRYIFKKHDDDWYLSNFNKIPNKKYDGIIIAVSHNDFKKLGDVVRWRYLHRSNQHHECALKHLRAYLFQRAIDSSDLVYANHISHLSKIEEPFSLQNMFG